MAKKRIRASVVCQYKRLILMVCLKDPLTGVVRWFPPGGMIEPGETPIEAARRETLEETGFKVDIRHQGTFAVDYPYTWNGQEMDVTTHFFKAELAEPFRDAKTVADASYLLESAWKPIEDLPEILGFSPVILESCQRLVQY